MAPKKEEAAQSRARFGRVRNNLKMGILGLNNVGISSLFNLLTEQVGWPWTKGRCWAPAWAVLCLDQLLACSANRAGTHRGAGLRAAMALSPRFHSQSPGAKSCASVCSAQCDVRCFANATLRAAASDLVCRPLRVLQPRASHHRSRRELPNLHSAVKQLPWQRPSCHEPPCHCSPPPHPRGVPHPPRTSRRRTTPSAPSTPTTAAARCPTSATIGCATCGSRRPCGWHGGGLACRVALVQSRGSNDAPPCQ